MRRRLHQIPIPSARFGTHNSDMKHLRSIAWLFAAFVSPAIAGSWQPWGPNGGDTNVVVSHPRIAGQAMTARVDGSAHDDLRVQTFGTHDFGTAWPDRGRFDLLDTDAPITLAMGGTPEYRYLTAFGRVYRSQDGGIAWTPVGHDAFVGRAMVFGANPNNGAEVVAQMGGSLFRSTDAGTTFVEMFAPGPAQGGSIDWSTRRVFLALNSFLVVAKSLDTGSVWATGPSSAVAVAAGLGHATAATSSGLMHSSDGGLGWQAATGAGAGFDAVAVAYAHEGAPIAYAVEELRDGRVIRSVDGGASWSLVGTLPAVTDQATIAVQAGDANMLLVGTNVGIFRSIDGGATWAALPRSGALPDGPTRAVVLDATNPSLRWLVRDVFLAAERLPDRTQDGGATWNTSALAGRIFAADPTASGHVFALSLFGPLQAPRSGVFWSIDGGTSFTAGVQTGVHGGASVAIVKGDAPQELHFFGTARPNPQTYVNWFMRSTDGGVTWTDTPSPPSIVLSASSTPAGVLYAGTDAPVGLSGLYRSTDNGATWSSVLIGDFSGAVTAVAVAPSNPSRLYAALDGNTQTRLATSADGGATWTPVWTAMPNVVVTGIAVDPGDAAKVTVATHGSGVFRSVDAGAHWTALDDGLADKRVLGIALDPLDATKLYASTESGPFVADLSTGAPAGYRRAIEFHHSGFDHYFVSADADEIAGLDAGVFEGWARTGESFAVAEAAQPNQSAVCRFFGIGFAPESTHFYTPYPTECEIVKADPKWTYEKIAFGLRLPETNSGCAPGSTPLYRMWNRYTGNPNSTNHRYTTSLITFFQMYPAWMYEGEASTFVFACLPE
jgi:photosystem II stability/assembly factor-like uncharacterized protein